MKELLFGKFSVDEVPLAEAACWPAAVVGRRRDRGYRAASDGGVTGNGGRPSSSRPRRYSGRQAISTRCKNGFTASPSCRHRAFARACSLPRGEAVESQIARSCRACPCPPSMEVQLVPCLLPACCQQTSNHWRDRRDLYGVPADGRRGHGMVAAARSGTIANGRRHARGACRPRWWRTRTEATTSSTRQRQCGVLQRSLLGFGKHLPASE
ncbi:MAG: hypothetical protein EPN49_01550 [Rhodanobacter sp.]|nr:MAG: hypothetical protein EPN49_01550 [Rhodanobacter sp.]